MKEKAAYLKGLIDGLGIDENTKEGKVIKAMSELLSEMAETVDSIDEDVTHAYDQINDLSEELEDLEADLYEDEDAEDEEDDSDDETEADDDDDNADVAGEPYYEVACPACGKTVYVSEDDLDAGEAICPSCKVAFEVALEDPEDDEAAIPDSAFLKVLIEAVDMAGAKITKPDVTDGLIDTGEVFRIGGKSLGLQIERGILCHVLFREVRKPHGAIGRSSA